jgi:mannose-6-phosphate isomerase
VTSLLRLPDASQDKAEIVQAIRTQLEQFSFTIAEIDATRPWGAFLRIENSQADPFVQKFFGDVAVPEYAQHGERSPKILLVAPQQRLSWQYHARRAEFWRAICGSVGVFISADDSQPEQVNVLHPGATIELSCGMRHRLVGLNEWGAVAEIWIHTDAQCPSNEADIFRLQDDYARNPI